MSEEALKYPQVTQDQIDIWLTNPVTQHYLQCLEWFHEELIQHQGTDGQVDSTSSDVTFAATHITMGQKQGLLTAMDYQFLLKRFNMVEPPLKEVAS